MELKLFQLKKWKWNQRQKIIHLRSLLNLYLYKPEDFSVCRSFMKYTTEFKVVFERLAFTINKWVVNVLSEAWKMIFHFAFFLDLKCSESNVDGLFIFVWGFIIISITSVLGGLLCFFAKQEARC